MNQEQLEQIKRSVLRDIEQARENILAYHMQIKEEKERGKYFSQEKVDGIKYYIICQEHYQAKCYATLAKIEESLKEFE